MSRVKTLTKPTLLNDTKNARIRHLVENNPDGSPKDQALCGYLWDMLNPPPNGTLCEECEAEMKRLVAERTK